ncbi:acetyl-CoA carboxylase biotin carboxylase subunit [Desulfitibacter alkalitolerans]|uniref:acetyl-CoA carboxylase biotin carboxylase subunit n=1 Tax=Desulfitibacter alkalitolerans TaxID=264641 RepID=UPI00048158FA|nr:biotin carboxylase N-terminal domain-containing protein [Desulfitibacter alkalitolerans]
MEREIKKVLVANRGVPAVRIMHTCRDLKIKTTAVYSTPDRLSQHVHMADSAVHIGDAPPGDSYLNIDRIIDAALKTGSDAVHPGWGFLAENDVFAKRVMDAGLTWIGPPADVIRAMGDKIESKKIAASVGIPVIPGADDLTTVEEIIQWMEREKVEFPIMIKASAGGGGKGMLKVENHEQIGTALSQVRSEAMKSFGDDRVLVEKYIERGRHIEVQIVADEYGNVVHLYERECTIQRRNQKIIEETPSPSLDTGLRREFCNAAVRLMQKIGYVSAGTVEFLFDAPNRKFYFLEVNTRLQVEHGITELTTGLDIVGIMIDVAQKKPLPFMQQDIVPNRWSLEVRLNAEDPRQFSPSFGTITRLHSPQGPAVRISPGVYEGAEIPPYYDSLVMLIMATGADRRDAIRVMDRAISKNLRVEGVKTLAPLLLSIIRHPKFIEGEFSTRFIEEHMEELVSKFIEKDSEDEMLKVARYVAEVSALGTPKWI